MSDSDKRTEELVKDAEDRGFEGSDIGYGTASCEVDDEELRTLVVIARAEFGAKMSERRV